MLRRFDFEAEIYETLDCVPMAVRRKLDRAGIKIGLAQWQALGRGERLAICHLPAHSDEEADVLRLFIRESLSSRTGSEPVCLPEADRAGAEPPAEPPATLVERSRAFGFTLDRTLWEKLDADERYALMKLGGGKSPSHNLGAALEEFFRLAAAGR